MQPNTIYNALRSRCWCEDALVVAVDVCVYYDPAHVERGFQIRGCVHSVRVWYRTVMHVTNPSHHCPRGPLCEEKAAGESERKT